MTRGNVTFNQLFTTPDVTVMGVVGSRKWPNRQFVFDTLDMWMGKYPMIHTLVSGGQRKGVDDWAAEYARRYELNLVRYLPAHWYPDEDDRYAEYTPNNYFARNTKIAKASDLLVAFSYRDRGNVMDTYNKARHRIGKRAHLYNGDDIL